MVDGMPSTSSRLDHLDGLRAFLMLVGIPYHAALAFSGEQWLVSNDAGQSGGLVRLLEFIHLWRMPTFFVVAGFFAVSVTRRRGPGAWYRGRLRRLGVPCLAGLLLVNPLQLVLMGVIDADSARQGADQWLGSPDKVLHMWFLVDLLVYCGLFALVVTTPARARLRSLGSRIAEHGVSSRTGLLPLMVLAGAAVAAGVRVWWLLDLDSLGGEVLSDRLLRNAPAFAAGVLLGLRPRDLRAFAASARGPVVLTAAGCALAVAARDVLPLPLVVWDVLQTVGGLSWAVVLFHLAERLLDRPSRWMTWLVDSSLLVYIVHHPLVLLSAVVLLSTDTPSWGAFAVTTLCALVGSLACFEVANRVCVLRWTFMGQAARVTSAVELLDLRPRRSPRRPAATREDRRGRRPLEPRRAT